MGSTKMIGAAAAAALLVPAAGASAQYYPIKVAPTVSLKVTPKRDKTKPFSFTASGKVNRKNAAPVACGGRVVLTVKKGGSGILRKFATLKTNCTYATKLKLKQRLGSSKRGKLTVTARFNGNSFLFAANSPAVKVRYGR